MYRVQQKYRSVCPSPTTGVIKAYRSFSRLVVGLEIRTGRGGHGRGGKIQCRHVQGAINVSALPCPEIKNHRVDDAAISGGLRLPVYDRLPEFKTVTRVSVTCIRNADPDRPRNIASPSCTLQYTPRAVKTWQSRRVTVTPVANLDRFLQVFLYSFNREQLLHATV